MAAYLLYVLAALEGMSRVLLGFRPTSRWIEGYDSSSARLDWVKRQQGELRLQYSFDVYNATRGWALAPGLRDRLVFYGKRLSSNSRGIRGKTEYSYEREAGKRRIVALGDSYTFGDEVSDDETYAHDLEELLPGTEVLNLGVHGYGEGQMLVYFEEEGVRYAPDTVLGFVHFDIDRDLFSFTSYAKPAFELRDGKLKLSNVPVPPPESLLASEAYGSRALDLGIMLRERVRWKSGANRRRAQELARAIFDELIATARAARVAPIFVYLPVLRELLNPDESPTADESYLLDYCRDRGIPCLDLRPRFIAEQRKGAVFEIRRHWTATEHAIAARGIAEFLVERRLLPALERLSRRTHRPRLGQGLRPGRLPQHQRPGTGGRDPPPRPVAVGARVRRHRARQPPIGAPTRHLPLNRTRAAAGS